MAAMSVSNQEDGRQAEVVSKSAAGVSKVEAFNKVLYQSGQSDSSGFD